MLQVAKSLPASRTALTALAFAALLSACASSGQKETAAPAPASSSEGISTNNAPAEPAPPPAPVETQVPLPSEHSVYFDFDKSNIKPEYTSVIDGWAKYLTANPTAKVQLQGNADERGSREYNLGLGERRANSVQAALQAEGVNASQLSTISYGKERPVCTEHNETCWQKNRRTDIVEQ
ncbi:MAG: peptidoglycan-associated lipoprotein Pal [Gammaproteobacteria bacterium]|nr:peptidoglycan-associated lipoprotein Pal [Gammaproteobacteria bacterium]